MDATILIVSATAITLALVFYSLGVWSEKFAKILKQKHLLFFWIGFVFDTTGTSLMTEISNGNLLTIHGIIGVLAIVLMLFHAGWATITLIKRNKQRLRSFHKFSIIVWLIWLIPYLIGFFINMHIF
jgi:uncharacterized repeat protein (TIGR03987 family)